MAKIQLTEQQQQAVSNRGGSLLVSAAAGSGKTKVLVERLFSYLEQGSCHVDDFLIITYTKAAAAELRGKIAAELGRRVAEDPDNSHLRRQLFRVYQADIKTVDAFCAGLLRENVHLLPGDGSYSLTPDFRIMDETESQLVQQRVLKTVLEEFYTRLEEQDQCALLLAETLGAGRDDRHLEELVLELYGKIQSHAYPLQWLARVRRDWSEPGEDLSDRPFARVLLDDAAGRVRFWAARLDQAVEDMGETLYNAYGFAFREAAEQLRSSAAAAAEGWDALGAQAPAFGRLKPVRGEEQEKERAKAVWDQCKADVKKISAAFAVPAAEQMEDLRQMAPAMLGLLDLTEAFAQAYRREKLRRNLMDFSDQEHGAIALLTNSDGTPTQLARQVSGRYVEIMVDEYQDTNEVQNCIFRAISREEQNLFVVGDVKQSIYRFRLADPTIFLDKYLAYTPAEDARPGEPRKVLLSRNFRSRQQVLESTNFVFSNVMSPQAGEMAYGPDEQLYFGAQYYLPREDTDTELHVISVEDTQDEQFNRAEVEARFVARRIRKLLDDKFPVQDDTGALRPVRPEDIVILMRSPRARQKTFTAALEREGIPCTVESNESLFATMEIAVLYSLLQIIDNPRQDVPLISVLRSPLFGFTPDQLARIRSCCVEGDYYDALLACEEGADFCHTLQELREKARDLPVDRLVWEIFTQLHMPAVFGAMDGGSRRKENLTAFYVYAGQMAAAGKRNLQEFLLHLQGLLENGKPPMLHTKSTGTGVQIMSIHKSKGLEFPVVILADLQKRFNADDLRRPVLVHPQLGLGTERVDLERRIRYDTASKTGIALQLKREAKAEEMRILYVAMTRAKEKLILVDCRKNMYKHLRDLATLTSLPVPPEAAGDVSSPGDWILLPLLASQEGAELLRWVDLPWQDLPSGDGNWQVQLWVNPQEDAAGQEQEISPEHQERLPDLQVLLDSYAHPKAPYIPSKVTATQLKGRELDEEIAQGAAPQRLRQVRLEQPLFLRQQQGLTAAEKGTAMHLVMQYLDFGCPPEPEAVKDQVKALQERRLLTPQQAEAVDCRALAAFLDSSLAGEIRQSSRVLREYRFALLVPASVYVPEGAEDEEMMLQGVVDCCFETPQGLVVVDFKTDRLQKGEEEARAAVYRPQLEAYAYALEQVLEQPVYRRVLYFFATGAAVEWEKCENQRGNAPQIP